jgi:von Willebrand factor type A domain
VAARYEQWLATRHGGCRQADLYLFPVATDLAAPAPAGSAQRPRLDATGLHPDLWLGSTGELGRIRRSGPQAVLVSEAIGSTPLLLAVPAARYDDQRDGGYRSGRLSWPQLFKVASRRAGEPVGGGRTGTGWGVVRPDPRASLAGQYATAALYAGLTGAATARQEVEEWIEKAQDAGGYPPGDEAALLCRQHALGGGPGAAALIVTEQAMVQFNLGRQAVAGCAAQGAAAPDPAGGRLVGLYPADTPSISQVAVRLRWRDPSVQSVAVRRAAAEFADWLAHRPEGKRALLAEGLRPAGLGASDLAPLDRDGALGDWPFGHPNNPVGDLAPALSRYTRAHRPARVLVLLDLSGSMRTSVGDGRRTRFDVAVDGVRASLRRMGGADRFGLQLFSTSVAGGVRSVLPLGRRSAAQDRALDRVAALVPAGGTPLYRAIDAGGAALRAGGGVRPDQLDALVVLTDGRDTAGGDLRRTAAGGSTVRVFVIAIGEASCGVPELVRVTGATGGGCLSASAATVDQTLGALFSSLWEGN